MRWEGAAAVLVIALGCVAATEVAPSQAKLAALYQKAEKELDAGPRPAGAPPPLTQLTGTGETATGAPAAAQESAPAAAAIQLRATVLLEQGKFDEAEAALNKLVSADQAAWKTKYIRARISLGKKDYTAARAQLQALLEAKSGLLGPETGQLIRYQLFLALLQEGEESAAQQTMDQFKFTDQTPALYYAQAAWNFQHGNSKQARQWIDSAKKLFSEEANSEFARTLLDLSSLGKETPGVIAAASPSPSVLSSPAQSPSPEMVAEKESKVSPPAKQVKSDDQASPAPSSSPNAETVAKSEEKKQKPTPAQKETSKVAKSKTRRTDSSAAKRSPAAETAASYRKTADLAFADSEVPTRKSTASRSSAEQPVPVSAPTSTPRPPFLNRLARTLRRTFKQAGSKTGGSGSNSSTGTKPLKPTPTPSGRRLPEN